MPFVTIRLDNKLMETVEKQAHTLHLSQSAYIRKAVQYMSEQIARQEIRESWMQASLACRAESVRINQEFSQIEGEIRENDSTY